MVNNLNDGLAWGLFPIPVRDHGNVNHPRRYPRPLFATTGMSITRVGILAALYPAVLSVTSIGMCKTVTHVDLECRASRRCLICNGVPYVVICPGLLRRMARIEGNAGRRGW